MLSGLPWARRHQELTPSSLTRCVCKRVFLSDPRGQQCQDQNRSEYRVAVSVHLRPLPSRSRLGTPYCVCVCVCVCACICVLCKNVF